MDENEAYRAMCYFLELQYKTLPDEKILGELLGGIALLKDGTPADAGYWHDWRLAVEMAKKNSHGTDLKLLM